MSFKRNPFSLLPADVINELNANIEAGYSINHIKTLMETKFKDIKWPSYVTFQKYIDNYRFSKFNKESIDAIKTDTEELEKELIKFSSPDLSFDDKKKLLELLIRKSVVRIQTIERWQIASLSPQLEGVLIRYLSEIRALIETLAKLNNELQPDQSVIINIIDSKVQPILQAFHRVLSIIAPDKIEEAKLLLKEEIRKLIPTLTIKSEQSLLKDKSDTVTKNE